MNKSTKGQLVIYILNFALAISYYGKWKKNKKSQNEYGISSFSDQKKAFCER